MFGPQKGAGPDDVAVLEAGLARWAAVVATATGRDLAAAPGAGAAGGTGFAALAVLGARRRPGIDVVLDELDADEHLSGAALVVVGEGRLDEQSLHGKAPVGVARRAAAVGARWSRVRRQRAGPADLEQANIAAVYRLADLEPNPEISIREAARLLEELAATRLVGHLT